MQANQHVDGVSRTHVLQNAVLHQITVALGRTMLTRKLLGLHRSLEALAKRVDVEIRDAHYVRIMSHLAQRSLHKTVRIGTETLDKELHPHRMVVLLGRRFGENWLRFRGSLSHAHDDAILIESVLRLATKILLLLDGVGTLLRNHDAVVEVVLLGILLRLELHPTRNEVGTDRTHALHRGLAAKLRFRQIGVLQFR